MVLISVCQVQKRHVMYCLYYIIFYIFYLLGTIHTYEIPEVKFNFFKDGGFAAAIEKNGAKNFTISGIAKTKSDSSESFQGVAYVDDDHLVYDNSIINSNAIKKIEYYILVRHGDYGYLKSDLTIIPPTNINDFSDRKIGYSWKKIDSLKCSKTSTTVYNKGKESCVNEVIFHDEFDKGELDNTKWIKEVSLPSSIENEFVSYQESGVSIEDNKLIISLTKYENYRKSGTVLKLENCTVENFCEKSYINLGEILPPYISGKISTKKKFNFKYGQVDIKAKLPQGDWVYPQLYLKPVIPDTTKYSSGEIRIAMARGNKNLIKDGSAHGNSVLYGGVVLNTPDKCPRTGLIEKQSSSNLWGDDSHIYSIKWSESLIELSVDGEIYGTVDANNKYSTECVDKKYNTYNMAPFDKEFYISIGLAVGGVTEFHGVETPWKDKGMPMNFFMRDNKNWGKTWNEPKLIIDYIKVTAV